MVTGIGGNVGQGILRNIKASPYDISLVGTNIVDFSAGNHLCDAFYKVPYAYEDDYIAAINEIVSKEGVDLILPATDFEVYYLSKAQEELGCPVAASHTETSGIYLDKYDSFRFSDTHNIPFAKSFLPSEYDGSLTEIIVKPRKGRGSRGIHLNPSNWIDFSDEEYMVQELHKGTEITTAFYVTKHNKLHGHITFERTLENGTTTHCKVIRQYDERMESMLRKMVNSSQFRGAANVQSIVTETGEIVPFEVNCRISGTNSIRSRFGFKDVEYTLQEWLFRQNPSVPEIRSGVATRILMDVIYEDAEDFDDVKSGDSKFYIF